MSNDRNRTQYLGTAAGPDSYLNVNEAPPFYKPGEIGTVCVDPSGRRFQNVILDSGCTAGSVPGVVSAGELAFWKDKSQYIVTNDSAQANAINAPAGGWGNAGNPTLDARNFVAGVFTLAVTATAPTNQTTGYHTLIMQRSDRAAGYAVKAAVGGTYNAGVMLVANTGTAADATSVAAGTAPTSKTIGTVLAGRTGGGLVPTWVNIQEED